MPAKAHAPTNNNRETTTLSDGVVCEKTFPRHPLDRHSAKRTHSSAAHEMDENDIGDLQPKAKQFKTEFKMSPVQFAQKSADTETNPFTGLPWNGNQLAHNTVASLDVTNTHLNGGQDSNSTTFSKMEQQMHNQQAFSMPLLESFTEDQPAVQQPMLPSAVKLENLEKHEQLACNGPTHSLPPLSSFKAENSSVQQTTLPPQPSVVKLENLEEHEQPVYNGQAYSMPLLTSFTGDQSLVQQTTLPSEASGSERDTKKKHKKHKKEKKKKSKEHKERKEHKKHKRDKKKSNSQQENDFASDVPVGAEASSNAVALKLKIPKCRIKYDVVGLANQSYANIVNSAISSASNISPPIPKLRIKIPKQLLNVDDVVAKQLDRIDRDRANATELPINQPNAQMVTVLFKSSTQLLLYMWYGLIFGLFVLIFCF